MPMPAVLSQTGTGAVYWTPDWMQNPFVVGYSLSFNTGTATLDVTFDSVNLTSANATWFSIVALGAANATGNYTTPVQCFRLNVVTATATSIVKVTFIQSTYGGS